MSRKSDKLRTQIKERLDTSAVVLRGLQDSLRDPKAIVMFTGDKTLTQVRYSLDEAKTYLANYEQELSKDPRGRIKQYKRRYAQLSKLYELVLSDLMSLKSLRRHSFGRRRYSSMKTASRIENDTGDIVVVKSHGVLYAGEIYRGPIVKAFSLKEIPIKEWMRLWIRSRIAVWTSNKRTVVDTVSGKRIYNLGKGGEHEWKRILGVTSLPAVAQLKNVKTLGNIKHLIIFFQKKGKKMKEKMKEMLDGFDNLGKRIFGRGLKLPDDWLAIKKLLLDGKKEEAIHELRTYGFPFKNPGKAESEIKRFVERLLRDKSISNYDEYNSIVDEIKEFRTYLVKVAKAGNVTIGQSVVYDKNTIAEAHNVDGGKVYAWMKRKAQKGKIAIDVETTEFPLSDFSSVPEAEEVHAIGNKMRVLVKFVDNNRLVQLIDERTNEPIKQGQKTEDGGFVEKDAFVEITPENIFPLNSIDPKKLKRSLPDLDVDGLKIKNEVRTKKGAGIKTFADFVALYFDAFKKGPAEINKLHKTMNQQEWKFVRDKMTDVFKALESYSSTRYMNANPTMFGATKPREDQKNIKQKWAELETILERDLQDVPGNTKAKMKFALRIYRDGMFRWKKNEKETGKDWTRELRNEKSFWKPGFDGGSDVNNLGPVLSLNNGRIVKPAKGRYSMPFAEEQTSDKEMADRSKFLNDIAGRAKPSFRAWLKLFGIDDRDLSEKELKELKDIHEFGNWMGKVPQPPEKYIKVDYDGTGHTGVTVKNARKLYEDKQYLKAALMVDNIRKIVTPKLKEWSDFGSLQEELKKAELIQSKALGDLHQELLALLKEADFELKQQRYLKAMKLYKTLVAQAEALLKQRDWEPIRRIAEQARAGYKKANAERKAGKKNEFKDLSSKLNRSTRKKRR